MHRVPAPGAWTVAQALNHIYLSEQLSINYVRRKLEETSDFPKSGLSSWVRSMILKCALRSPLKYKSPKAVNMREGQPMLAVNELHPLWMQQYDALDELIEEYELKLRKYDAFKHPVVGRMNLNQMLIFFQDHQDHHRKQIGQILKKVG